MIAALLAGVGVAAGLSLALGALSPVPPPLGLSLARLHARSGPQTRLAPGVSPWLWRLSQALGLSRLVTSALEADLAVAGREVTWFASTALVLGLVGVALGPAIALVGIAAGAGLPWILVALLSAAAVPIALGFHVTSLRREAARRRASFGFALSAYLDLVVVCMAAGRGVEGALTVAAESGSGWAFDTLRQALDASRLRGITPWAALDELGERLGVSELRGLAASIELAGASGAKVRTSVAARARALRARGLSDARSAAESATEAMSLPVVLLVVGFLILIGYPAVMQITTQL